MAKTIWRYTAKIDAYRKTMTESYKPYFVVREDGEQFVICRSQNSMTHDKMTVNLYRPTWWQNKIIVHTPVEEIEQARRLAWRYLISDAERARDRAIKTMDSIMNYWMMQSPDFFTDSEDLLAVVDNVCNGYKERGVLSPTKNKLLFQYTALTDLPKLK